MQITLFAPFSLTIKVIHKFQRYIIKSKVFGGYMRGMWKVLGVSDSFHKSRTWLISVLNIVFLVRLYYKTKNCFGGDLNIKKI